ncbi:MAG: methyltransferase regulatory domain-containing protein, partial [Ilumatobacteraceae bacterium]
VSYNTYPGWHARGMLRSMFARVVPDGEASERAGSARTFLELLDRFVPDTLPLQSWLQSEINMLGHYSDRYLFFEHLVDENQPFYFSDFVARARSFDLVHVGDAEVTAGLTRQVGEDGSRAIADRLGRGGSAYDAHVEAQQMLDYLTLRHFRRSLLTHTAHIDRLAPEFDVDAVAGCFVSLERLRTNELGESEIELDVDAADGLEVSLDEGGRFVVTSGDPVPIVAMWTLAISPRRGLPVDELVTAVASQVDVPDVRGRVHEWALTTFLEGGVQLSRWPRPIAYEVPEHPTTSRCARWQASQLRTSVTNLRHEELEIDDLDRVLVLAMDGSRSVSDVVASGLVALTDGTVEVEVDGETVTDPELLRELVETKIQRLVNRGLVLAD